MTTINRGGRIALLRRTAAVGVGSLVVAMLSMVTVPAQAAPPANDAWESATEVTGLPFRATVDTTEATKDAVPRPPGTRNRAEHSVWYHVTLPNDGRLFLSTKGSDYFHYLWLFHADSPTDTPDLWTAEGRTYGSRANGAEMVKDVVGGEDYFVMISTYNDAQGGEAKLVLRRPARAGYRLGQYGTYDRVDGAAVLKGEVKSDRPVEMRIEVKLRQIVGDHIVQGWGRKTVQPTREWSDWSMRVAANQPFRPGAARVPFSSIRVFDQGVLVGTFKFVRTVVTLQ